MSHQNKYTIVDAESSAGTYPSDGVVINPGGLFRIQAQADTWGSVTLEINSVEVTDAEFTANNAGTEVKIANGDVVKGIVGGGSSNVTLSLHRISGV